MNRLEKATEYILYLFLISLCCFKGMINAFGGLFVLTSGVLILGKGKKMNRLEKATEYILYLFLISLCCFKGMINAFGGLFVLTSGVLIYKLPNRKEFLKSIN